MKRQAAKTKNVNILWGLSRALQEQDRQLRGDVPQLRHPVLVPICIDDPPHHHPSSCAGQQQAETTARLADAGGDRREKINVSRAQGCACLFAGQTQHSWSAFYQWKQQYLSGYAPQLLITHLSWALLIPDVGLTMHVTWTWQASLLVSGWQRKAAPALAHDASLLLLPTKRNLTHQ